MKASSAALQLPRGGHAPPGFLNDFKEENNGDSREKMSVLHAGGRRGPDEPDGHGIICRSYQEYCDWTKQTLGWSRFIHSGAHNDYYDRYPDSIVVGRGSAFPLDADNQMMMAGAQWKQYREYVETHDQIQLMMGTAAEELIADENHKVIGLVARQGEKTLRIKANKGVILGTGGFDYNEAMVPEPYPSHCIVPVPVLITPATARRWGSSGGAAGTDGPLLGVPFIYDNPVWNKGDDRNYGIMATSALADWACYLKFPHAICVNARRTLCG